MDALKLWLKASGMTQGQFARAVGLTQGSVSLWFTKGYVPANRVGLVAKVTGLPPQVIRPDIFGVAA